VDCFRDGLKMLYIHPLECIDCAACVAACPVRAIFHENQLPDEWIPYRDLNATMARQSPRAVLGDKLPAGRAFPHASTLSPDWGLLRSPVLSATNR